MTSKKTRRRCASPKRFSKRRDDPALRSDLAREMAQPRRNYSAQRRDLLWLSLLSRDPRRQGADRSGDRLSDPDLDFAIAESRCHRLDHSQFLRLPGRSARGDFSTGAAPWFGGAWRPPDFLADEREARDRP